VGRDDLFIEVVVPRSVGADDLGNGAAPVAGADDGDRLLGHGVRTLDCTWALSNSAIGLCGQRQRKRQRQR